MKTNYTLTGESLAPFSDTSSLSRPIEKGEERRQRVRAALKTEPENPTELPDEFVRDAIRIAYRIFRSSKIQLSSRPFSTVPPRFVNSIPARISASETSIERS